MAWSREKTSDYMKEFTHRRREQHLCLSCGAKTNGKLYCVRCSVKRCDKARLDTKIKRGKGLCIQCGKPSVLGTWRCQSCSDSNKQLREKREKRSLAEGLCFKCAKRPHLNTSYRKKMCHTCYLKHTSVKNMNSTKYWRSILSILESQDYICPYSGEKIVLSQNDSIDHILPRSRFPALVNDISNIQWVTRHINHMKWDMTHDEFMETLEQIQSNCIDTQSKRREKLLCEKTL